MLFWKISLSILIYKEILENIIFNKEILENIYINKILNQLEFCIFNRAWRRRRSRIRTIFNGKSIDKKWLIGDHLPDRLSLLLGVRDGHRHPLPLLPPGRPELLLTLYVTLYGLGMPTNQFWFKNIKTNIKTILTQFCSNQMCFDLRIWRWTTDLQRSLTTCRPIWWGSSVWRTRQRRNKSIFDQRLIFHIPRQELFTLWSGLMCHYSSRRGQGF